MAVNTFPKEGDIKRKWHIVDAVGADLGCGCVTAAWRAFLGAKEQQGKNTFYCRATRDRDQRAQLKTMAKKATRSSFTAVLGYRAASV